MNQSNETKVNRRLFTRVFPRLAPSTLHQIHLKALLYSYVQAYRVNCPPRTDSFRSGWIWLQFKIPALRFSLNGKLFQNFLKTLTSPATLRFQIYRHFLALIQQMWGRKTYYASVCTVPKLKQTMLTLCWNVTRTVPLKSRLHRWRQIGSVEVSGELPTSPSPKSSFCPKREVSVNVTLGEG